MPYATSFDGTRLFYETMGDGEPLLLVSGQGGDRHEWDPVRSDFAAAHRVIAWDHRGTGQSDKPEEPPYTIETFARDGLAVLDALGIARAHVYGVSMGGRICQRLAIDHRERVGAVILGCTTPGNRMGIQRPADVDKAMANRPADPEAAFRLFARAMVSEAFLEQNPWYAERMRERQRHPIPPFAQKLHYGASEGHDAWDGLPAITSPVLVIHGDNDQVNPTANAPLLAGRIPGAELHLVRGGRHGYLVEFRDEASRVVLDFIARHPLGPA